MAVLKGSEFSRDASGLSFSRDPVASLLHVDKLLGGIPREGGGH